MFWPVLRRCHILRWDWSVLPLAHHSIIYTHKQNKKKHTHTHTHTHKQTKQQRNNYNRSQTKVFSFCQNVGQVKTCDCGSNHFATHSTIKDMSGTIALILVAHDRVKVNRWRSRCRFATHSQFYFATVANLPIPVSYHAHNLYLSFPTCCCRRQEENSRPKLNRNGGSQHWRTVM
jgi:hypothetical protein